MTVAAKTPGAKHRCIFRGFLSAFSKEEQPAEASASRLAHYELRPEMLDKYVLLFLNDHKRLHLQLGSQVKETELTEQIPPEYIGRVSYWNGGKLKSQMYLQKQVKYVEKRRIVFLPLSPLSQQSPEPDTDNKKFP